MEIDNKVLTLVNIYATNKDNPTFSQNLLDHLLSLVKKLLWEATLIWSWTVQKNKRGGNATTHRNPL